MSGFQNHAFVSGHPTLRRSGLDIGFQQTSAGGGLSATPVMIFNSGTDVVSSTNGEYLFIADNSTIQFTKFTVGFSICFRFNCLDFNNHVSEEFGSFVRRFAAKTDDALNGWNLVVYPTNANGLTGGVEMNILHDGVSYKRKTSGYNVGSYYQIIVTYDPNLAAANRIKIYTAGVETSVAGTVTLSLPTHPNLRIGARDAGSGFYYGYIQDFRMYMGKVLTQTEVTNLNTNELTIDNISKGRNFVVQYAMISIAMRNRTHKFHIGGRVIRNRTHKFNTIKKLTRTHTHKYNMVKGVTQTQTHKFNMVGFVTRLRTHKFGLGGTVRVTKTHKFNMMGNPVLVQVVRFQKDASGIAGATQDVTLNFTPKAIQVISMGTTQDNTILANYQYCHGFSDGTNHACVVSASRDAQLTSDTSRSMRTDSVVARLNDTSNNTVTSSATVAFATNKVTFTWNVNDANALWMTVLAIGGTGITNAKVNTVAVARTTTGVQNYTGLGFDPVQDESVIFTLAGQNINTQLNTAVDYANIALGCAVKYDKKMGYVRCILTWCCYFQHV